MPKSASATAGSWLRGFALLCVVSLPIFGLLKGSTDYVELGPIEKLGQESGLAEDIIGLWSTPDNRLVVVRLRGSCVVVERWQNLNGALSKEHAVLDYGDAYQQVDNPDKWLSLSSEGRCFQNSDQDPASQLVTSKKSIALGLPFGFSTGSSLQIGEKVFPFGISEDGRGIAWILGDTIFILTLPHQETATAKLLRRSLQIPDAPPDTKVLGLLWTQQLVLMRSDLKLHTFDATREGTPWGTSIPVVTPLQATQSGPYLVITSSNGGRVIARIKEFSYDSANYNLLDTTSIGRPQVLSVSRAGGVVASDSEGVLSLWHGAQEGEEADTLYDSQERLVGPATVGIFLDPERVLVAGVFRGIYLVGWTGKPVLLSRNEHGISLMTAFEGYLAYVEQGSLRIRSIAEKRKLNWLGRSLFAAALLDIFFLSFHYLLRDR